MTYNIIITIIYYSVYKVDYRGAAAPKKGLAKKYIFSLSGL